LLRAAVPCFTAVSVYYEWFGRRVFGGLQLSKIAGGFAATVDSTGGVGMVNSCCALWPIGQIGACCFFATGWADFFFRR
jgi:hypothetical protein